MTTVIYAKFVLDLELQQRSLCPLRVQEGLESNFNINRILWPHRADDCLLVGQCGTNRSVSAVMAKQSLASLCWVALGSHAVS